MHYFWVYFHKRNCWAIENAHVQSYQTLPSSAPKHLPHMPSHHEQMGECSLSYNINNTGTCLPHLSHSCKCEMVFKLFLIGISVKTYKVEYLFLYWSGIWISPFVKCLFMYFALFYCIIWCFLFMCMFLYSMQILLTYFFCKYLLPLTSLSFHCLSDVFSSTFSFFKLKMLPLSHKANKASFKFHCLCISTVFNVLCLRCWRQSSKCHQAVAFCGGHCLSYLLLTRTDILNYNVVQCIFVFLYGEYFWVYFICITFVCFKVIKKFCILT